MIWMTMIMAIMIMTIIMIIIIIIIILMCIYIYIYICVYIYIYIYNTRTYTYTHTICTNMFTHIHTQCLRTYMQHLHIHIHIILYLARAQIKIISSQTGRDSRISTARGYTYNEGVPSPPEQPQLVLEWKTRRVKKTKRNIYLATVVRNPLGLKPGFSFLKVQTKSTHIFCTPPGVIYNIYTHIYI